MLIDKAVEITFFIFSLIRFMLCVIDLSIVLPFIKWHKWVSLDPFLPGDIS